MLNKDQIKGKAKGIAGKIEERAGKLVGNQELEIKGVKREVDGQVEEHLGNLKEVVKNVRKL